MKRELRFLLGILLINLSAHSQEINVGDRVNKAVFLRNIKKVLSGDQLEGKWILLDFWSHTCINCIQSFPELDSFQKKFGDQLQIILVNRESADSTEKFFVKRKKIYRPRLPFLSGDTALYKMFPHNAVPYHVWIDATDTVRYATYGDNTTEEKISKVLNKDFGELVSYKKVKTISSLFDSSFFNSLEYFSYLSKCDQGYNLQAGKRKNYDQICLKCSSISELYTEAYNESGKFQLRKPGRVIIESATPSRYLRPENKNNREEWLSQNSYNYHLLLPEKQKAEKYTIMKADLNRYFSLTATIEKRKIKALALTKTSNRNQLKSQGGAPVNNFYYADESSPKNDAIRYLKNIPFTSFLRLLENHVEFNLQRAFFNYAIVEGNIDIEFSGAAIDARDYEALRKELKKYDLDLVETEIMTDVLIIKE